MPNKKNLLNQKFGMLTVIEEAPNDKSGHAMWKCQCDCGKIIVTKGTRLRSGGAKSCGCVRTKKLIANNQERGADLINQQFGLLKVIAKSKKCSNDRQIMWVCQCECGSFIEVRGHDLKSGNTKSCGCIKSYGERKISLILSESNIKYEREKQFNDLQFESGKLARFDFYLPDYNLIIEYDGIQHFQQGNGKFDNEEKFQLTQEHDKIKTDYCLQHNIKLVRIPYTDFDKISTDYLLKKIKQE